MAARDEPGLQAGRFDAIKRRAYLCAIFIGIPIDALGWLRLSEDPAIAAAYGAVTLMLVVVAVITVWPMPLAKAERIAFCLLSTTFLARLGVVLFLTPDLGAEIGELITSLVILSCVYLTAFLFLPRLLALAVSIGIVVCAGAMTLAALMVRVVDFPHGGMPLIKAFAMQAVLVPLLYVLAVTKEQMSASQAQAQVLVEIATTDPLTGVPNRRYLTEALERDAAEVTRSGRPLSVVMLDVDRFKDINDTHGHEVGDRVLCYVAAVVADELRASDVFGRWGGEEFLVISADTDLEAAERLADRCRQRLHGHPWPDVGAVTASFGIATFVPGDGWESLVRAADRALYEAKDAGRDCVVAAQAPQSV